MRNNKIRLCLLIVSLLMLVFVTSPALTAAGQFSSVAAYKNYLPALIGPDLPRWTGPDGGSIVSMAVDPKNGNIVYAGTWGSGVYKTTDGGAHWYPASNGITNMWIHNLVVDPSDSNRIYAGTYRSGVFRSDDGGNTWVYASKGMTGLPIVYGLAVNNGYPNMVYAGTRDGLVDNGCSCPPWGGVLYKSWDYGNTWTPVLYNVGGSSVKDWVYGIAVDPVNSNNVLAATHEHGVYWTEQYGGSLSEWHATSGITDLSARALVFDPRGNNPLTGTFDHDALYRSTDEGQHWKLSNSGLDEVRIFPNGLSASKSNPGVVYAASMSDPGVGVRGVFRSDDGGSTWDFKGLRGENLYTVRVSSTSSSVVYAGAMNDGLFKSTNGGSSWNLSMTGIANASVTGIVRPYLDLIVIGTYGKGILYSYDYGATWTPLNSGLVDLNVNLLYATPDKPYVLYALTNSAGLKRLDLNVGVTWQSSAPISDNLASRQWESVGDFAAVEPPLILPDGAQNPFKVVEPAEEMLSAGKENSTVTGGIAAALPTTAPLLSMTSAQSDSNVMYVGTNGSGVYATTNGGVSWSHSASGINSLMIRGLAVDPVNPRVVFAATNVNGVVLFTEDGGSTWGTTLLPKLPIPNLAVYSIATGIDANGADVIYVGTSNGLWINALGSPSWYELNLYDLGVTSVATDPAHPGAIFAGTTNGAYYSSAWRQWSPISTLTYGHTIQTIGFDPDMKHVYFGANTHGLFIQPWEN